MESDCEICSHDPNDMCLADHPVTSLRYTRRKDHDGPHVTCGFSAHAVESWYDDDEPEPNDDERTPNLRVRQARDADRRDGIERSE